jgi:tetratricopeptide (TPR) repeat protein
VKIPFSAIILIFFIVGCQPRSPEETGDQLLFKTVDTLVARADKFLPVNIDSSIWYARQAYHLTSSLKDNRTLHSLYTLSRAMYNKGELYEALKYLLQAHELSIPLDNRQITANISNMKGNVYGSLGQYDKAVEEYLSGLSYYREIGDKKNEAKVYNNLGLVYYRVQQLQKAYGYHQKAMAIWDSIGYEKGLGSSLTNLSYIYASRESFDTAFIFLDKALDIYQRSGNLRRESNTYINIGWVYMKMGNPQKALDYFERSLPMSKKGGFKDIYTDGLNKKGWALYELKHFEEAQSILQQGLNMAIDIKDPSLINEINERLTNMYASMGDFQSALVYQNRWATIKDSIFQDKSAEYIALFEVIYQTEAKEKRIELLEEVNKRRALLFRFSIFLAVLLLVVIALVVSRYRIKVKYLEQEQELREKTLKQKELEIALEKTKNEQLQNDIQHRHSELSSATLHLYQKNESLSQLLEEVENVEKRAESDTRQRIRMLKNIIKSNLNLDDDWNNFKMYFNQVHHGFIERLNQNFPSLTNHDLRHCSYIRMNLSTKEIAPLTNISVRGLEISRYRLRKKLNLGRDVNLTEYILNI